MTGHQMSQDMRQCIDHCTACHQICLRTIQHCLDMGGKHAEQAHVRVMADCAQICTVSADFMLRMSDLHGRTCGVCAEACQRCADDCDRVGGGTDPQMKQCADACRRCAESCRKMAAAA
uniref:Uncharacterized cysteine-rich DUF326 protein bsYhjQ/STM1261 n=1 Tax=uncultured Nocardioidaceae bacterium TaxID=253824 RepID=A0A6J4MBQ2_9ACTN|nr:MAG: Uncharacterized cysteine-rich DUF326 protein bsYhjQ/STM1261 [uncultured Nocardioidaceae bacterium]